MIRRFISLLVLAATTAPAAVAPCGPHSPSGAVASGAQAALASSLVISPTTLPPATIGQSYSVQFVATGGVAPYIFSFSGNLPAGLTFTADGLLSGMPTASGVANFTIGVEDSSPPETSSQSLSLTIQPGTVPPASNSGALPSTFFGMHTQNYTHWPTVSFGALGKGALVVWPYIEKQKGVFNWSNLDAWVNTAETHGLDFFYAQQFVPPWAAADPSSCGPTYSGSSVIGCKSTVANLQDWDNFVTALVSRYKGRIKMYELWNEPQNYFSSPVSALVTLTTHEYNIIRSIDPAALIASPSPTTYGFTYIDNYFAAGGPKGVDEISNHCYPGGSNPTPEAVTKSMTSGIKAVMTKYGLSSKPLSDTEGSWGTLSLTTDQRAAFAARYLLLHWSMGYGRFYWYSWDNQSWGTLWTPDQIGATAAAAAYQQVQKWMIGNTLSAACAVRSDGSTWTCGITRPDGSKTEAVWNTAANVNFAPGTSFLHYLDIKGALHSISGNSVTIGPKPILLEP